MPDPFDKDLESSYDKIACEFLQHSWDSGKLPPPDGTKVADMRENIPASDTGRTPGQCDVLTTYLPITDDGLRQTLSEVRDDVEAVLPPGFDFLRDAGGCFSHFHGHAP